MIYNSVVRKEQFIIKKDSIVKIFLFLTVLISFLFSKTAFFGIGMKSTFQWVFYAACVLSLLLCNGSFKTLKRNICIVSLLVVFLAVQILHGNNLASDGLNTIIGFIFVFVSCCCLAASISKELFQRYYLFILTVFSLISIPCFIIAITIPDLARSLSYTSFVWDNTYEYSWFYTWGRHGTIVPQNAGPFWEPGAFQGFLVLGILIIINDSSDNVVNSLTTKRFQMVLFAITLLTTQSTTGYILCVLVVVVFFKQIGKVFAGTSKHQTILYVMALALALAAVIYIFASNNISDKLTNENTQSATVRYNDLINSLNLVFSRQGLFGMGPTKYTNNIESQLSMVNNSVGLLSMTYTYGIIFGLYYLGTMFLGVRRFFNNFHRLQFVIVCIIFVILHMTEGLWNLPIYILILMSFKEDKRGVVN